MVTLLLALELSTAAVVAQDGPAEWLQEWEHPSRTYRPRVRWGWPGNAITPEGIDADLRAFAAKGIGGVEIVTYWQVFQQGNIAPLSPRWFELVRHALATARELDMDVALTFTEAGWSFGGNWVPPQDRSKVLVQSWVDVQGPGAFDGPLPRYQVPPVDPVTPPVEPWRPNPAPDEQAIVAVVAGRVTADGKLDGDSLTMLPAPVEREAFSWTAPPGTWRLMVFQLKYTGQINQAQNFEPPPWVVDHLGPDAMRRFIETLGGRLHAELGHEFGRTLDSLYCDSFEVKTIEDSVLWSHGVLPDFAAEFGYDFTAWLPAIWWDIGPRTPRLRHDLNTFLHQRSIDGLLLPFMEWCESHGVEGRIEPIDTFPGEVIESSGWSSRPETEKSMQIFAVSTYPRKCQAAGLRFYGNGSILSAEAFTVLQPQRYRTSLEDMKITADGFLRDGVTQFYGHGAWHTREAEIVPSRDFPWATRISPANTWWPHFDRLMEYLTRCAVLLRQGNFCGDLLVYSPQDDLWSDKGVWGGNWRTVPFARLGTTLVANGYDFDPVNNDVLLHRARVDGTSLAIGAHRYRAAILPDIECMPPEVLAVFAAFARAGGTVVALNGLPVRAPGTRDQEARDGALRSLVEELFGPDGEGRTFPGGGATFRVSGYPMDEAQEQPYIRDDERFRPQPALAGGRAELIRILRSRVDPDVALPDDRQSNGLTFLHRRAGDVDLYFVTNLEAADFAGPVRFRVQGKSAELWDPETGVVTPAVVGREQSSGTDVWLTLDSLETCFVVFKPGEPGVRVIASELPRLRHDGATGVTAQAARPGRYAVTFEAGGRTQEREIVVEKLPSEVLLDTDWTVDFGSAAGGARQLDHLASWTADPATRQFSGTATYTRTLHWEPGAAPPDILWELDLGAVGDIAELQVNGQPAGVRWKRPHRFDVTNLLRPGRNELRLRVTNRLINRIAGMTETPPIAPDVARFTGPARPLAPRVPDTFDANANARDWGDSRGSSCTTGARFSSAPGLRSARSRTPARGPSAADCVRCAHELGKSLRPISPMKTPLVPLLALFVATPMLLGERGNLPQYAPPEAYLPGETLPYFGSENPWDRRFFVESSARGDDRFGQRAILDLSEGRTDMAITACRERLAEDGADLEARFALMIGLAQQDDLPQAEQELNTLLDQGQPVTRLLAGPRALLAPLRETPTFQHRVAGQTHGLVHGPMLGAVTPTGARFWVRTEKAANVEIRLSRRGHFDHPDATGTARSSPEQDFTAVVAVDGLQPATTYEYALLVDGVTVPRWPQWTVRTFIADEDKRPVHIALGSCAMYAPVNERMWDVIALRRPDAFLLLGDNVYLDLPEPAGPFHDYSYYCRQSRPEFRRLVSGVPVYAIWDDHDAGMDDLFLGPYADKPAWKPTMLDLFRRNWNNPAYGAAPARPGVWFKFRVGAAEVFMLDCRYYRENWLKPHPSMLGPVQLAWLKQALTQSTATFKLLVSSVPWSVDAKLETDPATGATIRANDDWNGFPEERTEIYNFLADHHINGVLLLSGDRHRTDLRLNQRERGYPLYELMCSRLTNTKPVPRISGNPLWSYGDCAFAVLHIDPGAADPTLTMEVASIEGETVFNRTLHLSEMSNP